MWNPSCQIVPAGRRPAPSAVEKLSSRPAVTPHIPLAFGVELRLLTDLFSGLPSGDPAASLAPHCCGFDPCLAASPPPNSEPPRCPPDLFLTDAAVRGCDYWLWPPFLSASRSAVHDRRWDHCWCLPSPPVPDPPWSQFAAAPPPSRPASARYDLGFTVHMSNIITYRVMIKLIWSKLNSTRNTWLYPIFCYGIIFFVYWIFVVWFI